jgi:DNA-binding NtrC family response regulator
MPDPPSAILLVEDDLAVGKVLAALLAQAGIEATHVTSGSEALVQLEAQPFDAVISDLRMPGMDGLSLLAEVSRRWPDLPFILVTADGSVPLAVEAMKGGAADFLMKPIDRDELLFVVRKAVAGSRTRGKIEDSARAVPVEGGTIGESRAIREVLATVRKAAIGTATVLIRGETGTGKELIARAVHEMSPRKGGPFVKVHCAALPDALLESELFGHERGAFTGASTRKPGRVELAEGGTLFLDEIGDITPMVQVKLLRVLQDRAFERLGGTQTLKADVRFVAATHRDLEAMVARGEFRQDLFYRLCVVPVVLPPLRERPEDIERLARHFVMGFAQANGRVGTSLDASAVEALCSHAWPGNVRQLQNLMERLVVLAESSSIGRADVEREMGRPSRLAEAAPQEVRDETAEGARALDTRRREAEREAILGALAQAKNNRSLAARLLCVSRRTLYNKLREHSLE